MSNRHQRASAISFKRRYRAIDIRIEGGVALIVFGTIAVGYLNYLIH